MTSALPAPGAGVDVFAIWKAARRDPRLDQAARKLLAHIARAGRVAKPSQLRNDLTLSQTDIDRSFAVLRELNYLPPVQEAQEAIHHERTAA